MPDSRAHRAPQALLDGKPEGGMLQQYSWHFLGLSVQERVRVGLGSHCDLEDGESKSHTTMGFHCITRV